MAEIRAPVIYANNIGKGMLKLLPKYWKYVRETGVVIIPTPHPFSVKHLIGNMSTLKAYN